MILYLLLLMLPHTNGKGNIHVMNYTINYHVFHSVAQITPSSYITSDAQTVSVSGSSATGNCSSVSSTGVRSTCTNPASSVLFDGVIPTLTGLDGDMWASQLLTLQTTATRTHVLLDFTDAPNYNGAISGRLEVVMFNCPEKGISASTIRVSTSSSPSGNTTPLMVVNIGITSCDSLVTVCTPIATLQPSITLEFVIGASSDMVYLAEVTFYAASSASTCPPDTIITTAPPDTIITTAPPDTIITTAPPDTIITTARSTRHHSSTYYCIRGASDCIIDHSCS